MPLIRRQFLRLAGASAAACAVPRTGGAQQNYPDKPVRILLGFAAGGPGDILSRVLGEKLSEAWGRPSSSRASRALAAISQPVVSPKPSRTVTRC
jgi:hypothetical protein